MSLKSFNCFAFTYTAFFATLMVLSLSVSAQTGWDFDDNPSNYTGAINLTDDLGISGNYSRFGSTSPTLSSQYSSSLPPIILQTVMNPEFIDISIVEAGTAITKETCTTGTWEFYASVVTMCDQGQANNIAGMHIDATDGGATVTPRLWLYTDRSGTTAWNQITGSCAQLETRQRCRP